MNSTSNQSNMSISKTLLVIIVALAIHKGAAQAPTKPTYTHETCGIGLGNYSTNSIYEANLLTLLSTLIAESTTASFSNDSVGISGTDDKVFGQYYCRGDINTTLCSECVKAAAATVFVNCHNFKFAVIWFEECTLRYDNVSMVGVEAERPGLLNWSLFNVTDPLTLGPVLNKTTARLINEAAKGNSSLFATGEGVVSKNETVYCLVQCSPDINGTECETCLRSAHGLLPAWGPKFAAVYLPSCHVRYSVVAPFYPLLNAPPPGAPTPSAPPPVATGPSGPPPLATGPSAPPTSTSTPTTPVKTASPPTGGSAMLRAEKSLNIGLVISAVVFTLLRFA